MLLDFVSTTLAVWLGVTIIWLITLVVSIIGLINRKDILLPVKVLWGFLIFVAPFLGLILYLIYGGSKPNNRLSK